MKQLPPPRQAKKEAPPSHCSRRMRAGAGIFRAEVEIVAIPLAVDVNDVVEVGVRRRRLEVLRLEHGVDERLRLLLHRGFDARRYFRFGGSAQYDHQTGF